MATPTTAIDLKTRRCSERFVQRIPIHFARRHVMLGLEADANDVLEVVTDDARRLPTLENLALTLGCEVRASFAEPAAVLDAIDRAYQQQTLDVAGTIESIETPVCVEIEGANDGRDLLDNASRAPVVKLVNQILFEASRRRASDVHVQPIEQSVSVRLRVDGVLINYVQPPLALHEELISRIKVMGGMDIAEKRLPQDGRTTVRIGTRLIDLRISIIPTAHGERAVLRLLDKGARLYDLDRLGMGEDVRNRFEQLITLSHGLILMTGPTGSGKSTTLYAALQRIDYSKLNVVTLEDPIEYHLPGISQTQVSSRKGMTFATGLRSVLRQDPDVIMVGEIRDSETARLAVQSALTGHLVLSTLHTNDAPGAVARLLDLGIEPFLVADSLLGVGAQRLVRLICPQCRTPTDVDQATRTRLNEVLPPICSRGAGCDHCGGIGYYEREGIFEFLTVDENVRQCIHDRSTASLIRQAAIRGGMRTLRQDGIRKIAAGQTTPEEVLRVTQQ